jgi:alginate O-acetyltransferase complex protein AlgI
MSFLSLEFVFFFAAVIVAYYLAPARLRWKLLLAASVIFFGMASMYYLFLVIILTLLDYGTARLIVLEKFRAKKKLLFTIGITANVLVLFFFKYANALADFMHSYFSGQTLFRVLMPLGISYFIFKKISYLTDVYREKQPPEKNFARLLLYVLFFPEIAAGPIDRSGALIPQFDREKKFDTREVLRGIQLVLWGVFKKLVIADRLAILVNQVYGQPENFQGLQLVLATVFFSIQIYCDFSGYSDIAIGIGHTLGYQLMDNFNRPYFSRSITDFWGRWHISLSSWLRDYIFLPLAYSASRKIKRDKILNMAADSLAYLFGILLTMTLCGLWHGAGLTFLFWGFLHGFYLAVSFLTRKLRKKIKKRLGIKKIPALDHALQTVLTFFLVSFAWIFFRAASLGQGFLIIRKMLPGQRAAGASAALAGHLLIGLSGTDFCVAIFSILLLFGVETLQPTMKIGNFLEARPFWQRWLLFYALLFFILFFGVFAGESFIYEGF